MTEESLQISPWYFYKTKDDMFQIEGGTQIWINVRGMDPEVALKTISKTLIDSGYRVTEHMKDYIMRELVKG